MATTKALRHQAFTSSRTSLSTQSRSITTSIAPSTSQPSLLPLHARRASFPWSNNATFRPTFRRAYVSVDLGPTPKKKRAGFFRWTWRLTKLAALGGAGYLTWNIWYMRHPADQIDADPSKKTLVVLGTELAGTLFVNLRLT